MMTCRDCGDDFDPRKKKSKKGFKNQCDYCSQDDETERVLGFNDGSLNKSTSIAIYKGNDPKIRKAIQNQKSRTGGF